ncbi:MAG: ribonuclease HII [candidate division WOR-3 bacterium]
MDGFSIPGLELPQYGIVRGDRRSLCIAAASIVAKVTRDRIMVRFGAYYPEYGFEQHKGYPTRRHLESLTRFGPCSIHRLSFGPVRRLLSPDPNKG